jgi:ribonuclease R
VARRISPPRSSSNGRKADRSAVGENGLPSREALLEWVRANPDLSSKRDIAKAFGIKGDQRAGLKQLLGDLIDDGELTSENAISASPAAFHRSQRSKYSHATRKAACLRAPSNSFRMQNPSWCQSGTRAAQKGPAPGVGDRVLAKIFGSKEKSGPAYSGRVIRLIDRRRDAVLGVVRKLDDGSYRLDPVERRQPELIIAEADLANAKPGDLVEAEPAGSAALDCRAARSLPSLGRSKAKRRSR